MPNLVEPKAHKEVALVDIQKVLDFIKKYMGGLADADDRAHFSRNLGYMEMAMQMVEEDNMRATCLYDAATQYANQLAFRLYIEGNLADGIAAEFRELEPVKTVVGYARAYTEESQAEADAITKLQRGFMERRQRFEVFQAVIEGMSKEEAEAKQAAYNQRKAEALANVARG